MATVFDLAAVILERRGRMTTMKLQKLVYYSQAWSLVWDSRALFDEEIQAWANGPVCPPLYQRHHGKFEIGESELPVEGSEPFSPTEIETIEKVLDYYGEKSSHWLSELSHEERPWVDARRNLSPGERGTAVISHAAMAEYYGSL